MESFPAGLIRSNMSNEPVSIADSVIFRFKCAGYCLLEGKTSRSSPWYPKAKYGQWPTGKRLVGRRGQYPDNGEELQALMESIDLLLIKFLWKPTEALDMYWATSQETVYRPHPKRSLDHRKRNALPNLFGGDQTHTTISEEAATPAEEMNLSLSGLG